MSTRQQPTQEMMNWRLLSAVVALITVFPILFVITAAWLQIQMGIMPWSDSTWLKAVVISLIGLLVDIKIYPKAYRRDHR